MKKLTTFCRHVCDQFVGDGCVYRAGSLAYATLLSLVPLFTVVFLVISFFPFFIEVRKHLQDFIFSNFVATSAEQIQIHLNQFISHTSSLSAFGMIFLLLSAIFLIFTIEQTFNAIWRVRKSRGGVAAFFMYWGVLTLFPVLIATGMLFSSTITSLPWLGQAMKFASFTPLYILMPKLVTFALFTLLYIAVPNCKVPLKAAALGGFIATVLFEIAKWGFTVYVQSSTSYALLYGALSTVPIFLMWIYVSWLVILLGAVVSYVMTKEEV